jgi:hypothetical protein
MALTKLTYPGLDIYVDLSEVKYIEREIRPNNHGLILPNEKDYYTKIALGNGRVIACTESVEYIMGEMAKATTEKTCNCA